jgi:hypothetical protein
MRGRDRFSTWWAVAAAVCAALLIATCGQLRELPTQPGDDDEEVPDFPPATLTRIQTQIFTPTCTIAGCHDAFGRQSDLVLTAGQSYANLVNRRSVELPALNLVTPGDHENSYLYRKVTGINITGDRMPQLLPPLSEDQIRLIRGWIRRGAPND